MNKNKQNLINQKKLKKNSFLQTNPNILFILFFLAIKELQKKKEIFSKNEHWPQDEYIVIMEDSPAFPNHIEDTYEKKEKKTILNIKNSEDFYIMIDKLKPYMNKKNQYLLSLFEKWRSLAEELNTFSHFKEDTPNKILSIEEPKEIVNLLQDLKPFIQKDYYFQLEKLSDGINEMIQINENVLHLKETFEKINNIEDKNKKIDTLLDGFEPFMDKEFKKTIQQVKTVFQIMDLVKTTTESKSTENNSNQEDNFSSNLMEILDLLDSSSIKGKDKSIESEDLANSNLSKQNKVKEIENSQNIPQYEEIFEENLESIKKLEKKEILKNDNIESKDIET